MKDDLNKTITALPGIGKVRAAQFEKLGISTLSDLLYHFPRAYQNRGDVKTIAEAAMSGETCATILTVGSEPRSIKLSQGKTLTKFTAFDDSGKCTVVFFNQNYVREIFTIGSAFRFWGKIQKVKSSWDMSSPAFEPYNDNIKLPDFIPVYPATEGLSQKIISNTIGLQLIKLDESMPDPIPEKIREKYGLMHIADALKGIHIPADYTELDGARRRFIFEELYIFALGMASSGRRENSAKALPMAGADIAPLVSQFGFELTGAQKRTINEIYIDMTRREIPMCRLVSGDVGSGKTVCAAGAAYIALKNGYQAALMAPTEILANQHYNDLAPLFRELGFTVEILTGALTASEKRKVREKCASGEAKLLIGTHALITESTVFENLGLVITDEQHRFGVMQRAALTGKGKDPHMLVMTATPIPRTLALILYGDLDISVIDEMPAGRQKIDTFIVNEEYRERLNKFIRQQVKEGHQVYIVCPAVDSDEDEGRLVGIGYHPGEEEAPPLKSAVKFALELQSKIFPDLRVAFLHGKMKGTEKDRIMQSFAAGQTDVLVSTTVIEVGVNVPNATLMIIENAERFGLSQLHQLRGRVGRGKAKSFCILVSEVMEGSKAMERLDTIRSSNNGYVIAEQDLKLRGPGDFFPSVSGEARQHGEFKFRLAALCDDVDMLKMASGAAKEILDGDPELEQEENAVTKQYMMKLFEVNSNTVS